MTDDNHDQDLVLERVLPGPPATIWAMWTRPEHFAAWYGPTGATITVATMDVRVGGARLLRMDVEAPHGSMTMWFAGTYLEVIENQRLVYTDAMSDERGNVLPAEATGAPAGHPTTTRVQLEMEPSGAGTRVTLTHVGIPEASPGAAGWEMALDKLERLTQEQSERS